MYTNKYGRGTVRHLRLTRASFGSWVSVAKTYRDEMKNKMNISARSQWPSSAVEFSAALSLYHICLFPAFQSFPYYTQLMKCIVMKDTTLKKFFHKTFTIY